jgi:threonine dehydratase
MAITSAAAQEARRNIAAVALRTPLIRCNADSPATLSLKLENLQPIGSFKIRGAANVMARTPRERLARGVLTASAGNMAQGVAFCARRIGVDATIIAPDTAPATKIRAVERMGGRVIQVSFAEWWRTFETRSYPGIDATFIHAFDDPDVMAGNGTIALELLEDLPDLNAVVIPWGGGGLSCGIAAVLRELAPRVRIYAAEIETAAPLAASLAAGEPQAAGRIVGGYTHGSGERHESGGGAEPGDYRRCCSLCGCSLSGGPRRVRQDCRHRVWWKHRPRQVRSTGQLAAEA